MRRVGTRDRFFKELHRVDFLFNVVHCSVIIGLHAMHCTAPTITLQSTAVHYIEQKIDFMCIFKEVISRNPVASFFKGVSVAR